MKNDSPSEQSDHPELQIDQKVELQFGFFTPLIGQNNVGKSNILNAIAWLIKPGAVEPSHFNSEDHPIEVEAVVEGITEELLQDNVYKKHADRVKPFLQEKRLVIKRVDVTNKSSRQQNLWVNASSRARETPLFRPRTA